MRGMRLISSTAACAAFASTCHAAAPMDYLHADGRMGKTILPLTQGLLIISAVVVVIIAALVLIPILWRSRGAAVSGSPLVEDEARGWISIGVGLSTVVLVGLVVWTSVTMARIANPPSKPALSIEVRGHQWWWEFAYLNDDPVKDLRDGERDPHSGWKAGSVRPEGRRRYPHVLGAEPRWKDSAHSRANQCHMA